MHTQFSAPTKPGQGSHKAPSVRIKRKMKVNSKWTFCAIPKQGNEYLWDYVTVNDKRQKAEGGSFYIEWVKDGRKFQKSLSTTDGAEAHSKREAQEELLSLQAKGHAPDVEVISRGLTLKDHFDTYLDERRHALGWRSVLKYRKDLDRFLELTSKRYVNQITREDIIGHVNKLMDGGMVAQTAKTDAGVVLSAVRAAGNEIKMRKGDWPKAIKREVEVYSMEDLKALFEAANDYETAVYKTALKSGLREQELMFLTWKDVNWNRGTLSVTAKAEHNFRPKNSHERSVPVPTSLLDLLENYKAKEKHLKPLIFHNKVLVNKGKLIGGGPDRKLLERLKRLAFNAGLNCGECIGSFEGKRASCAEAPVCGYWFLHKFRATAITQWLRDGVDVRTVQALAGHESLNSTIKYLAPLPSERLAPLINGGALANI